MIRQAISCDICGAEKKQTNHWFVAYEQAGELRVSGWASRNRLRTGSKHLCGQACLHKLADEFMERTIARKGRGAPVEELEPELTEETDTSLTAVNDYREIESSARLIPTPAAAGIAAPSITRRTPALVPMPERISLERMRNEGSTVPPLEPPRYASRNWRAEAWERERERTISGGEHRPGSAPRRFSQA